jgi:hypothetical protein
MHIVTDSKACSSLARSSEMLKFLSCYGPVPFHRMHYEGNVDFASKLLLDELLN